jgi:hypothetical protein
MPCSYSRLVIIDDLDVKGMPVTPPKADPPLLVDSDTVLALSITLQSLELIRTWNRKVLQISGRVQLKKEMSNSLKEIRLGVLIDHRKIGYVPIQQVLAAIWAHAG